METRALVRLLGPAWDRGVSASSQQVPVGGLLWGQRCCELLTAERGSRAHRLMGRLFCLQQPLLPSILGKFGLASGL